MVVIFKYIFKIWIKSFLELLSLLNNFLYITLAKRYFFPQYLQIIAHLYHFLLNVSCVCLYFGAIPSLFFSPHFFFFPHCIPFFYFLSHTGYHQGNIVFGSSCPESKLPMFCWIEGSLPEFGGEAELYGLRVS